MSETNKANTVAFNTKAVFEGDVENPFRIYGGALSFPKIISARIDDEDPTERVWR